MKERQEDACLSLSFYKVMGRRRNLQKKLDVPGRNREAFLRDCYYRMAHRICMPAESRGVSQIAAGHTEGWKQNTDMGKKNNQVFVTLPLHFLYTRKLHVNDIIAVWNIRNEKQANRKEKGMSPEYLVKVEANANNNKYYRMIPHENDTWTAEYGRIGSRPQKREYDASQFEKKLNEKLRKGYARQTEAMQELIQKEDKPEIKYKPIKDKSVADIAKRLQDMARKAVSDNYTISSDKVTKAMLDEAQTILAHLVHEESVRDFNEELLRLFTVIPRKMSNVSENLAQSESDFADILVKEQNLLDVMKGQVIENAVTDMRKETQEAYDGTVLDSIGVFMEPCDAEEIELIKKKLGRCAKYFKQAWRAGNHASSAKFDMYTKERKLGIAKQKLLWHGSRNENWWSILQTGLVLKPTNAVITGKMFGYGIYYATKAAKSIGYTSMTGSRWAGGSSSTAFMALMSVAYGKPYDVYSFDSKYYNFDYKALQKACPGADCLHAHAGKGMLREDEIIVYREDQCTIRYLVELYS